MSLRVVNRYVLNNTNMDIIQLYVEKLNNNCLNRRNSKFLKWSTEDLELIDVVPKRCVYIKEDDISFYTCIECEKTIEEYRLVRDGEYFIMSKEEYSNILDEFREIKESIDYLEKDILTMNHGEREALYVAKSYWAVIEDQLKDLDPNHVKARTSYLNVISLLWDLKDDLQELKK